jgi:hypothetical protein
MRIPILNVYMDGDYTGVIDVGSQGAAANVVAIGTGANAINLTAANTAVAYAESADMFGKSNGIMGLAYTRLNNAFSTPGPTWPATYSYNQIQQQGRSTFLNPYFTQLEAAGMVANKFAFYTKRSMVSNATANPLTDTLVHRQSHDQWAGLGCDAGEARATSK